VPSFVAVADEYLDRQERNDVWRDRSTRTLIGLPLVFRDLPTDQIDAKAVFAVLEPFGDLKPETARRASGRMRPCSTTRAGRTTAHPPRRRGRDGSR
jgi:hypothetical protein